MVKTKGKKDQLWKKKEKLWYKRMYRNKIYSKNERKKEIW